MRENWLLSCLEHNLTVVSNGPPLCPLLHDHLPGSSPVLHCSQGLTINAKKRLLAVAPKVCFLALFVFLLQYFWLELLIPLPITFSKQCIDIGHQKVMPSLCLMLGISPTLFTFSFICLLTSVWSWCVIPETRGLTLTQVNHVQLSGVKIGTFFLKSTCLGGCFRKIHLFKKIQSPTH